jgi:hypothetical protein
MMSAGASRAKAASARPLRWRPHRLREELAQLLANNRFVEFEARLADYGLDPSSAFIKHFSYTSLFASFMYALEKRGWTGPGISWQVELPMTVQIADHVPGVQPTPATR